MPEAQFIPLCFFSRKLLRQLSFRSAVGSFYFEVILLSIRAPPAEFISTNCLCMPLRTSHVACVAF